LIANLWPDADLLSGRNRLSMALSALRHVFEPHGIASGTVLMADRLTIQLNPAVVTTDTFEFENTLKNASQGADQPEQLLAEAVELYHGPLLRDYYEDWILREQKRLADLFLQAVRQLISIVRERNALDAAIEYAQRAVALHPEYEEAHQELMRAFASAGQRTSALLCYQDLERRLQQTAGREPSADTRALRDEIQTKAHAGFCLLHPTAPFGIQTRQTEPVLPSESVSMLRTEIENAVTQIGQANEAFQSALTTLRTMARGEVRIPVFLTRFFGREREIEHLCRLLQPGVSRLVTLTGPAGVGKTRLAMEAARSLYPQYQNAIYYVPFTPQPPSSWIPSLRSARPHPPAPSPRVPSLRSAGEGEKYGLSVRHFAEEAADIDLEGAIAAALGLPLLPDTPRAEQIALYLQHHPSLLVLEGWAGFNLPSAALITSLLERAPLLTCLVTSRQSLAIEIETEVSVEPLPAPKGAESLERLEEYASVRLFVARATAINPDFRLTDENAKTVAEVCRLAAGMPLTLELAAAGAAVTGLAEHLLEMSRAPSLHHDS
jgi:DNA-binding SARP family transcriptional activator